MRTVDRYVVRRFGHEHDRPPEELILKEQARVEGRCIQCGDYECKKHEDQNRRSKRAIRQWQKPGAREQMSKLQSGPRPHRRKGYVAPDSSEKAC